MILVRLITVGFSSSCPAVFWVEVDINTEMCRAWGSPEPVWETLIWTLTGEASPEGCFALQQQKWPLIHRAGLSSLPAKSINKAQSDKTLHIDAWFQASWTPVGDSKHKLKEYPSKEPIPPVQFQTLDGTFWLLVVGQYLPMLIFLLICHPCVVFHSCFLCFNPLSLWQIISVILSFMQSISPHSLFILFGKSGFITLLN